MLDMRHSLHFPDLKFYTNAQLSRTEYDETGKAICGTIRSVKLYKLNWSRMDQQRVKDHKKWCEDMGHPHVPLLSALPAVDDEIFSNLVFALDYKYLNEIHFCVREAYVEWSRERPFDTMIRELCLKPAQAYVETAFKLLCDCVFDEDRQYYRNDWVRLAASHALLYKFWYTQTGRGLLWDKAGMERLNVETNPVFDKAGSEDRTEAIRSFYDRMKAHEGRASKVWDNVVKQCQNLPSTQSATKKESGSVAKGMAATAKHGLTTFGRPASTTESDPPEE